MSNSMENWSKSSWWKTAAIQRCSETTPKDYTQRPCGGGGFRPAVRGPPRAGFFYLLRGGAGCGPDQCGAGRAAGQDISKYAGAGRAAGRMIQLRGGCGLNFFSPRSLNSLKICTLSVTISWWIT